MFYFFLKLTSVFFLALRTFRSHSIMRITHINAIKLNICASPCLKHSILDYVYTTKVKTKLTRLWCSMDRETSAHSFQAQQHHGPQTCWWLPAQSYLRRGNMENVNTASSRQAEAEFTHCSFTLSESFDPLGFSELLKKCFQKFQSSTLLTGAPSFT